MTLMHQDMQQWFSPKRTGVQSWGYYCTLRNVTYRLGLRWTIFQSLFSDNSNRIHVFSWNVWESHHRSFFTPDLFNSTILASWGSSKVPKAAEFHREFNFLGFSHCFSARIKQSSKTFKIKPNYVILGWFFEVCSILS